MALKSSNLAVGFKDNKSLQLGGFLGPKIFQRRGFQDPRIFFKVEGFQAAKILQVGGFQGPRILQSGAGTALPMFPKYEEGFAKKIWWFCCI